jgi:hypothetical protein
MLRTFLLVSAFMGLVFCSDVFAKDFRLGMIPVFRTKNPKEVYVNKSIRKVDTKVVFILTKDDISPRMFNIFEYFERGRGRIPICSVLKDRLLLEFGLSGYLGIKWLF